MADWRDNKLVGVIAAVVFIVSLLLLIVLLRPRSVALMKTPIPTPSTTPFVK
ncbi:MAG: hypothetical protein KKE64_05800 [Candidatus Omnitrophica bacterium]|nr:hypothetical protein [Candidatus Omnitrophota bacterium]